MDTCVQRAELSEWYAESLRLTAFTLLPPASHDSWWQLVTGDVPDTETVQRKIGQVRVEGKFGPGGLVLEILGNKIDWVLAPSTDPSLWKVDKLLPNVGLFNETRDDFVKTISRWLVSASPVVRLAFGARLMLPVADKEEAYRRLSSYLPFNLDEKNSSDFNYQINRPRKSRVLGEELRINRLMKWASILLRAITGTSVAKTGVTAQSNQVCFLELDINTDAAYDKQLPEKDLLSLFQELVELANEIAEKGDIP